MITPDSQRARTSRVSAATRLSAARAVSRREGLARHSSRISVAVKGQEKSRRNKWSVNLNPSSVYGLFFKKRDSSMELEEAQVDDETTDDTMFVENEVTEVDENHPDAGEVYLCLDVSIKFNVVISQWCLLEEKSDDDKALTAGTLMSVINRPDVDDCTLPSRELGKALARLHCNDTNLNLMFRKWSQARIQSSFRGNHLQELCTAEGNMDRTASLAESYGVKICNTIMENLMADLKTASSLEEPTTPLQAMRSLGASMANLHAVVDDDSRCRTGPIGRDIGMPLTFAISSALTYAIRGKSETVERTLLSMKKYRDAYVKYSRQEGKPDNEIRDSFLNGLGWCGWFLYLAHYRMTSYMSVLPLDGVSDEDKEIVLDGIGMIGLKFMKWEFGDSKPNVSLSELFQRVDETIEMEIDSLSDVADVNMFGLG